MDETVKALVADGWVAVNLLVPYCGHPIDRVIALTPGEAKTLQQRGGCEFVAAEPEPEPEEKPKRKRSRRA